jgi:hypothetical protein
MHDWPNAPTSDPVNRLAHDVRGVGTFALTAAELGARFGIQRLTTNARAHIAADLVEAGLVCTPALADAKRSEQLMLAAAPQRVAAASKHKGRALRWLAAVPAVLMLLLLLAAASRSGTRDAPTVAAKPSPVARGDTTGKQIAAPAPTPSKPVDDTEQVRARADEMASAGKWMAATKLLYNHDDDTYADNLARRGAHRIMRSARRALRAGRYDAARMLADRADRLAPSSAATDVRRSAMHRAAARKKAERLARDRRYCSVSEKDIVDYTGRVPSGCGAYARAKRKRAEEAAAAAEADTTPAPNTDSSGGGSSSSRGFGCDGDPGATPYPQFPGQRDGDGDGCYGES